MLGHFFGNTKDNKDDISLVIDLRSSSVGAAIVKTFKKKGTTPLILSTHRENIFYKETVDAEDFIERSMIALKKTLEKVEYRRVNNIHVTYGSPWYHAEILELSKSEKKNITLSRKYINEIINENIESNPQYVGIERKLLNIKVNGYRVDTYVGKKTKKVSFSMYRSYLYKDTIDDIEDMISKYYQSDKISHHTLPYLTYSVLNKEFDLPDNITIFDISGEITDIAVIRKEFRKLISTPYGSHYFAREMTRMCKYNLETAYSKINLITSREVDPKCSPESVRAFLDSKRDWGDYIKQVLNDNKIKSLPATVFVISDRTTQNLVEHILNDVEVYSSSLKFGRKPEIVLINSTEVEGLCEYPMNIKKDALLSLQANYANSV